MEAFDWDELESRIISNEFIESGYAFSSSCEKERSKGSYSSVLSCERRSNEGLMNHKEAERRRRARINAHLDTFRSVIPGAHKMDKASLLGEVIRQLKELKGYAEEACEGLTMVPNDKDEIRVEEEEEEEEEGNNNGFPYYAMKASVCCEYKPGLLCDIRRALDDLHLVIKRAEIATLGGRMKNVFVLISCKQRNNIIDGHILAGSVHRALKSVIDRFSSSQDIRKRRRVSIFSSVHHHHL